MGLALVFVACGRTALIDGVDLGATEANGGDAAAPGSLGCSDLSAAEADAALMERWNAAVEAVAPPTFDFHWRARDDFPHPTFRTGTPVAYSEFVDVLLRFWASDDTIEFVSCNRLFERRYNAGPPVATQLTVQLRPLTKQLSTFRLVSADRQAKLAAVCRDLAC